MKQTPVELNYWDRQKAVELMMDDAKKLPEDTIQTTSEGKAWKKSRFEYHLKQIAIQRKKDLKEMMKGGEV